MYLTIDRNELQVNFFDDEKTDVEVQILVLKEALKEKKAVGKQRKQKSLSKNGNTLDRLQLEEERQQANEQTTVM